VVLCVIRKQAKLEWDKLSLLGYWLWQCSLKINGKGRFERYNVAGASFFICVNSLMTAFMGTIGLF